MATPVKEIRLFRFGANETEKGTFYLTPDDAKACMAAFKARGTDLSWDYDHDVAQEGAQGPRLASAWSQLEVRKDGLWATNIRWTKRALGLIDAEEYRYFSPYFEHTEDGHVTNIVNVALTNIPATHGIDAIAASAKPKAKAGKGARVAHGRLTEIPRASARRATTTSSGAGASGKTTMNKDEMMKALAALQEQCNALAAKIEAADDDTTASDDGSDDDKDKTQTSADDGSDSDKKDEATSVAAALCAHTGEKSPLKALAKVLSSVQGASATDEKAEKAGLIAAAVKQGKLQPALKSWAETLSVSSLKKFLSGAKPIVATREEGGSRASDKAPSDTSLSEAEKKICKDMGITHEKFIAQRTKLGAGGGKLDDRHGDGS